MNQIRVTQCGNTVFAIGQLFDPNNLIDPRTTTSPVERATHQFDGLGIALAANEEAVDAAGVN